MVTFKKPIGSISVSGHKFIGSPVPCGVVMTRQSHIMALSSNVEYLNSRDATIMGSRNGHAPIYLWYMLSKKGYDGMRKDVEKCLRNAHVLKVTPLPQEHMFNHAQDTLARTVKRHTDATVHVDGEERHRVGSGSCCSYIDVWLLVSLQSMLESAGIKVMLNGLSSTVVFERPEDLSFVRKWQLACEGDVAHVVVMPNIGIDKLQVFVQELIASRASVAAGKAHLIAESALAEEMKMASLGSS